MSLKNLERRGYKVISTSSNNRYKHIILKKDKNYFLKISKKKTANLSNEVAWNNEINKLSVGKSFCCPEVIEFGKDYALFEYFSKPVGKDFEKFIPKIIDLLFFTKNLKLRLPIDDEKNFNHDIASTKIKILNLAENYSQGKNFPKLLKIIKNTTFKNKSLAHCEIKPAHLYNINGKLGLIDGEWASMKIPEHYDLTSCYARTFIENPSWAEKLFLQYEKRCKNTKRFREQFRGLLAWRAIGEYSDAHKERKLNKNHKELISRVLENRFGK